MTSFAHVQYPHHHPGVDRLERAGKGLRRLMHHSLRSSGTLLLAAIVAAVLVIANEVIDAWTEGHLLVAWIAMWAVAFAAMAMLATPTKHAAKTIKASFAQWQAVRRQAAADRALWQLAQSDSRVMADLTCAMSRADIGFKGYFGD